MVIDEGLSLADDLTKLTDGELNLDDALAVLDLVTAINIKVPKLSIVKRNPNIPSNIQDNIEKLLKNNNELKNVDINKPSGTNLIPNNILRNVLSILNYNEIQIVTKRNKRINAYYNKRGNPKYLVISDSYHHLDAFKGYENLEDLKRNLRSGSYDIYLNKVSK